MTGTTYRLTLADMDGSAFGVAECPMLPRFVHIHAEGDDHAALWEASDDPEPADTDPVCHVDSFARVGSSVWIDDQKDALFIRVVA